ncbi:MAG: hypothetical protein CMJ18_00055 [Phycisphaeraceae bacterium]|nr:hypothetical protein [Phycisphaeraceae bacterium]
MTSPRTRPRGFTLIELLVVISIIALLIAMLLPAVKRAKQSAMQITCASNLRQIGIGISSYMAEYDQHYPTVFGGRLMMLGGYWGSYFEGINDTTALPENRTLNVYMQNLDVFLDPGDVEPTSGASYPYASKGIIQGLLVTPGVKGGGGGLWVNWDYAEGLWPLMYQGDDIVNPSRLMVIGDAGFLTYHGNIPPPPIIPAEHTRHSSSEDTIMANVTFSDNHTEFIEITRTPHRGLFGDGYHTDHGNLPIHELPNVY